MTALKNKGPSARKLAYRGLWRIFEEDAYANLTIQHILKTYALENQDRRFLTELIYGVCRRYNRLLWVIGQVSSRSVDQLDPKVRLLLCLGLYQIMDLRSVPDPAAVNETVKIAKSVTHAGNVRFINAVLRNYLRKQDTIHMPSAEENPVLHDSLFYNQPEWLVRKWSKAWGREKACSVFAAFNEIQPTDIRVNTLKISRESLLENLQKAGASPVPIPFCAEGLTLQESLPFFKGPFLKNGDAYVQNRASMIPALILNPQQGERVLDMCAAPGSKTTQVAAMMGDQGVIDAWDLYPHKIRVISENCRRLSIHSVHARVQNASEDVQEAHDRYDRVLLDAPCSGFGVIGRKTEMRWRRTEKDLAIFPDLQKSLLERAAFYVKQGGYLVYSTCTLIPEENEDNAAWFLSNHPEFEVVPIRVPGLANTTDYLTLWPDVYQSDGFFAACFRRRPV